MIEEQYVNLKTGLALRKTLIAIKQELKEEGEREKLLFLLDGNYQAFTELLQDPDPKVRKNAALVLGLLGQAENASALYEAYCREQQLFVKSSYLKALAGLDCACCQEGLKKRLLELEQCQPREEEEKHIREELAALRKLVQPAGLHQRHSFQGYDQTWEIILTTGKKYQEITARQVKDGQTAILKSGVRTITSQIGPVLQIPTYRELLFLLDVRRISGGPKEAARALAKSNLLQLLQKAHGTEGDFYFRLGLKSAGTLEQRSIFAKKCAFALEQETKGRLKNSPSDYELEIRLMENQEGQFLPLVKLYTFQKERFSYRKHTVAASIRPELAALLIRLAEPYLKEQAQVLDPFCGVGTMLIERDRVRPAGVMYGVDIFGEAIAGAKENTQLAEKEIYYINRDFFEFTHKYQFDEIITDMPDRGKKTKEEHDRFYGQFFQKAAGLLKEQGIIILYTNEKNFVKKQLRLHKGFTLLQEYSMDEKERFFLFVIEKRK